MVKQNSSGNAISSSQHPRKHGPRSLWALAKAPIKHLKETSVKKGKNSAYTGREIDLLDVQKWENFITVEDVEELWVSSPKLLEAFSKDLQPEDTDRITIGEPITGGMFNEMCLERAWTQVSHLLNLALQKCAKAQQDTDTPLFIMMADGENAQWISPDAEETAEKKRPDYASFQFVDKSQFDDPKNVFNRIPGDAKQFRKICRAMLPPDGKRYKIKNKNVEAQKVLNQIHGYMDQHEARYGYIVNNEELICLRRKDTGWGQLEISDAIPHGVEADRETNVLNSKYVLLWLHLKAANDDSSDVGWRLRSFGSEPESDLPTAFSSRSSTPVPTEASLAPVVNEKQLAQIIPNIGRPTKGISKPLPGATAAWKGKATQLVTRLKVEYT